MGHGMEHWHPNPDFFYKPGGGPILDMGPYYITNLVNLVGPVKRVAALSSTPRKQRLISSEPRKGQKLTVKTPTTYHALLEFANGAMVTLVGELGCLRPSPCQHGDSMAPKARIFVPDPNFFGGEVKMAGKDAEVKTVKPWDHPFGIDNWDGNHGVRWANYRTAGLADMAAGIIGKRDVRCSIERMAHVVDVMTSIMKSGTTGKFVDVKSTCARPKPLGPAEARALMK